MQTMTQYLRQEGLRQGIAQGLQQGLQKGMQQGIQTGIDQEKHTVAKNMRREGLSTQTIAKVTGLRREEIEQLK